MASMAKRKHECGPSVFACNLPVLSRSPNPPLRRLIEPRRGLTEPFDDKTADQAVLLWATAQVQAAVVLGGTL
jgi:hypothetical protein